MQKLIGKHIKLRALEPEDLEFLFTIENNENFWEVSHTQAPFSKFALKNFIENSHLDIYTTKQFRFLIEEIATKNSVGMVDVFDFNPQHKRAGVGIVIAEEYQQNGYASEALEKVIEYGFSYLGLHQLYANITSDNIGSLRLFEKHQFKKVGEKRDWISSEETYKNEILFQRINE